jgi:predicted HicB family RNase H-like nuclease
VSSIEELKAEIAKCQDECLHEAGSAPVEHMLLLSKCIMLLSETVLHVGEVMAASRSGQSLNLSNQQITEHVLYPLV